MQLALQFIGGATFVFNRQHGTALRWNHSEEMGFEVPEWANAPRQT
jgi:hypothetical protein